ncbi:hypothetical protein LC605_07990 [Nostoc sp. CHAB 5836]|uniref:hypothetical protein n=1 Tax=Nostoc sp. CHAB 5836 TaxID=2780404 RepID=UPI001E652661|nr:hypothetical protein [Nostoc sp. CHAB 5836]MCC5615019.1 hypothetical protein [Nostoc sp. CHAB 5836]
MAKNLENEPSDRFFNEPLQAQRTQRMKRAIALWRFGNANSWRGYANANAFFNEPLQAQRKQSQKIAFLKYSSFSVTD